MKRQTIKAFTLVELIVVITIIAILGTIAFISLQGYSSTARDSVRISDVKNIEIGLELYTLNSGKYPEPDDLISYTGGNSEIKQGVLGKNVSRIINLNTITKDPSTNKNYVYSTFGDGKYYQVAADKENFETSFLMQTYADSFLASIVKGSYDFDPSLPSLILVPSSVTASGIYDPNVCFVIDGGQNTLNKCNIKKSEMNLKSIDASLVGYWDMETLTVDGKLKDLSGNGNNGTVFLAKEKSNTIISETTYDSTPSLMGKGGLFNITGTHRNSTGKVINVGTGSSLNLNNNASFSMIIKTDGEGWRPVILGKGTGGNANYSVSLGDLYDSPSSVAGTTHGTLNVNGIGYETVKVNDNEFKFLTFVFNDKERKFFVNGQLIQSYETKEEDMAIFINDPVLPTTIAGNYSLNGVPGWYAGPAYVNLFSGIMDEVKIYNRALTDSEVMKGAKMLGF